jgi:hypothetical protein
VGARIRVGASGIALLALACSVSACGGSQDGAVTEVAGSVHRGDGAAACATLAPTTRSELEQSSGKPCAAAILEEVSDDRGDGGDVQVFGSMAQVRWRDRAVFLTRMPDGWRVLAAGCVPRAVGPDDCAVTGA